MQSACTHSSEYGLLSLEYNIVPMPGKCKIGCFCVKIFGLKCMRHPSTAHADQPGDSADRQQMTP